MITCRECGKKNPDDGLYCEQCGTLLVGPDFPAGADAEPIPDWLRGVGAEVPEPLPEDSLESGEVDWLEDFAALVEPGEETAEEPEPAEGGGLPAWLEKETHQVAAAESDRAEQEVTPPAEQPLPDWLAETVAAEDEEEAWRETPAGDKKAGVDQPDWLAEVAPDEDAQVEADIPVPPWMAALTAEDEGGKVPAEPVAGGGLVEESAVEEDTTAVDLPDWLHGTEAEKVEQEAAEAESSDMPDVPDWLAALEDEDEQETAIAYGDQELPEWLAGLTPTDRDSLSRSREEKAVTEAPESEPVVPEPEEPPVKPLMNLGVAGEVLESETGEEWAEPEESFTDWAAALDESLSAEPESEKEPDFDFSALGEAADKDAYMGLDQEALPDWLQEPAVVPESDLTGLTPEEEEAEGRERAGEDPAGGKEETDLEGLLPLGLMAMEGLVDEEALQGDLPDWLADVMDAEEEEEPASPPEEEVPRKKPVTGELVNVPPLIASEELPEWLMDNPLEVDVPLGEQPPEEVPTWLQPAGEDEFDELLALDEAEAAALASSGEWAALLEDLPDAAPAGVRESLTTADIPEWLEALRPAETSDLMPAAAVEPTPQAGPLAGYAGVINIEPSMALPKAAKKAPVEFVITPEQRQQVALLQQLVAGETEPAASAIPLWKRDLPSPLRIVLGFLLLVAIIIGLFVPPLVETELPAFPAALPVSEILGAAANRPVLVAFEYTPAMAGELTPMAEMLLAELAAQSSPVLLVSQSATGLTIGERTAAATDGLAAESLRLVPGEAVGLRQLGSCLNNPAGCATLYGQTVNADLQDTLGDLGLILILAAERDGLVSWMEQVSPLVEVPLVAGVTQSLSPVARPYFQSAQLAGVLDGFPAAVAYEQAIGQEGGQTGRLWAVTLAQWLVVAALVVGNVFWWLEGTIRRDV